jgi:hypothetical protein
MNVFDLALIGGEQIDHFRCWWSDFDFSLTLIASVGRAAGTLMPRTARASL